MSYRLSKEGSVAALGIFAFLDGDMAPMGEIETVGRRGLTSLFRFTADWMAGPAIPPAPTVTVGRRGVASEPHPIPLFLYDSIPDGWGRHVLDTAFPGHAFTMLDYLAAAGNDRTGFLGTGDGPGGTPGQWLPDDDRAFDLDAAPTSPEDLLAAAEALQDGRPQPHHLTMLLRGSPALGGARPKSTFIKADGQPVILKFPVADDAFDEQKAEAVCLRLADRSNLDTPGFGILDVDGRAVLTIDRFDRGPDGTRLAYTSACVVLGADPTAYSAPQANYADLCIRARRLGIEDPSVEIFRRMIFNAFIHNTDDHLFNHGFVRDPIGGRWRLSPIFDIVPQRRKLHVIAATRDGDRDTDPLAKAAAYEAFGLTRAQAREAYAHVADAMLGLPDALDEFAVDANDRRRLRDIMPLAFDPPPLDP